MATGAEGMVGGRLRSLDDRALTGCNNCLTLGQERYFLSSDVSCHNHTIKKILNMS
jgi:hypothetical protein